MFRNFIAEKLHWKHQQPIKRIKRKKVLEDVELDLMSSKESQSNRTSDCDSEQYGPREQVDRRKREKGMTTRPIP